MKQFRNLLLFIPLAFGIVSCNTDDLKNDIDDLKDRVTNLEAQVQIFNENLNALRVLTQDDAKTIKNWSFDQVNGKYAIELSDGQTIVLTQGVEGSATTPDIKIGTDGYWYIDGQKQPVKAQGSNAPTPEFRITSEGYWQVDLDGKEGNQYDFENVTDETGAPVKATTSGSINMEDQFFKSVKEENGFLVVEVKGYEDSIKLPIDADLVCEIVRTSITGLKDDVLTVGYGMDAEFTVKVNGERYAVTAPAGWTAILGEPAPETNEAILKLTAPAQPSTLSRATADNTTDLTLQVNNGVNWAVDKIKVVAENVVASYYELFNSGQTIEIAGVELKSSDWDENFTVKQITPDKNGTEDNKIISDGIYFISAGAIANLDMPLTTDSKLSSNKNLYIFRDNSNDNTAKLIVSRQVMLNNADATSKFLCEGLSIDATSIVNEKNEPTYMMGLGGDFGEVIFKNCAIKVRTDKTFAYISAVKTLKNLHFESCKFNMTGRTQKQYFNLPKPTINVVTLKNNIFYAGTADSHTTDVPLKMFTFAEGKAETLNMENNSFVNTVPLTDGFIACKTVNTIHIKNNLFYSSEYKNNNNLIRYENDNAENPQIPETVVSANNYANKGSKIWKVFYSNGISEGSEQVNCNNETIFKTMDYDKVVFKPIDALSAYGATIE